MVLVWLCLGIADHHLAAKLGGNSETPHQREAMTSNPYAQHLDKRPANYRPLTPLTFLERAAAVYPEHVAEPDAKLIWPYPQAK